MLSEKSVMVPKVTSITVKSPPKERSFTCCCPACGTPIVEHIVIGATGKTVECLECGAICHVKVKWE